MEALSLGSRREVCWDEYLMDTVQNVRVWMHRPEYRGDALTCDAPWEGNICGYFVLLPERDQLRLYYRGASDVYDEADRLLPGHGAWFCYAESRDGRSFRRAPVNRIAYAGQLANNIIAEDIPDNLFVFRDDNPDCPADARYKGLDGQENMLWLYESADGVQFRRVRVLCDDGAYDSMNTAFWDAAAGRYFLFYRGFHGGVTDGRWSASLNGQPVVRDIRVRTSADFIHWDAPQRLQYVPEREDAEMYTNQIQKYYRADHMFIGFPTRYVERVDDAANFPELPDWPGRQRLIRTEGRSGTAMTDALVMTSRDGFSFRRTDEAFLTPGVESGDNWYYGDCYFCYGMAETSSDIPGAPHEISLYVGAGYRTKDVVLQRYAVRLDGFLSWHSDFEPGIVVTRPVRFDGNSLTLNFSTSAAGWVRIRLLGEDGTPLEGYDSGRLFGDSVDRNVRFAEPLSALAGETVRMEISMRDAELYAFRFFRTPFVR